MEHGAQSQRAHTQFSKVLELARRQGLLRASDLDEIAVPRVVLTRMVAKGLLTRVGRGLYRSGEDPGSEYDSMAAISLKVPKGIFCLLSALQFHELTTQLPREVWIAMPRGSHVPNIDYPPLRMVQFAGEAYSEGIEIVERDKTRLAVYCVAKTIADCFKYRNRIGLDVALEALRDARSHKKVNANDLWRFAKICRVANVMRPYLEAME